MKFRIFNSYKKVSTGFVKRGILREVIDKNIRVNEHLLSGFYFVEKQLYTSSGRYSGSRAMMSTALLLFAGTMPLVALAILSASSTTR